MLKKIKREICLIKYRNFPLFHYDKEADTEVYYYPKYDSTYWIKLENNSSKKTISELIKLIKKLEIQNLIFLDGYSKPWISKFTSQRKSPKSLIKAIEFFKSHKINTKFNGGVQLNVKNIKEFLPHFYMITECDGSFFHYHFMDEKQNMIFYLHYSGEIQVLPLNKKSNKLFLEKIKELKFIDSFSENADRI